MFHECLSKIRVKQDTCPSIQRRTGIPLQQKIHFGEHEKRKKKRKNTKDIWIVDVFHEGPIHTAISLSVTFMMQDSYPELGLRILFSLFHPHIHRFCEFFHDAL